MSLRTGDEFRQGLADGRRVFYRGRRIDDVVSEPELALAVDHSAICYDIAADRPDLAVAEVDGEQVSAFYVAPSTSLSRRRSCRSPARSTRHEPATTSA
ncbi:hypothetical protein GON09_001286 [Rhodococcus sp. B50]|nr:hypothetical protein [Rhodococcus sp. B50]